MARALRSGMRNAKRKQVVKQRRRSSVRRAVVSKPKNRTRKLSAKALASRRKVYAAKFFPYIEKVARRLARRLPAHVEIDDLRARDTLSRDMRRLSNELREATRKLESELGRSPDQGELAETLGLKVDELYTRQQKLSGSSVVGIDDAGPDFLERTSDVNSPDPFELTAHREALARLVSGIDDLPEKMQQVLSLYYCENMNLKEIGEILGVTESRVCQIHGEATRRLRESLSDIEDAVAA